MATPLAPVQIELIHYGQAFLNVYSKLPKLEQRHLLRLMNEQMGLKK